MSGEREMRATFGAIRCRHCGRDALSHPAKKAKRRNDGVNCMWTWFGVVVNALRG